MGSLLLCPDDVLECVRDFSQSALLSHVCQRTWKLLGGQHCRMHISATIPHSTWYREVLQWMERNLPILHTPAHFTYTNVLQRFSRRLCSLTLTYNVPSLELPGHLRKLQKALVHAPALQTLRLDLAEHSLLPSDAKSLAFVRACPALHTIQLDLGGNKLRTKGIVALVREIDHCSVLRVLQLALPANRLCRESGRALAMALAQGPILRRLEALHLDLSDNLFSFLDFDPDLFSGASPVLQTLSLRKLHLNLANSCLTEKDIATLVAHAGRPPIVELSLCLSWNRLDPGGAVPLGALRGWPCLARLEMNLSHCGLAGQDAKALAALHHCPSLEILHLDLTDNPLGPSAVALAALSECPSLHSLHLYLKQCCIGDAGARELDRVCALSPLKVFHLGLGDQSAIPARWRARCFELGAHSSLHVPSFGN